eukprot:g2379.t1
MDQVCVLMGSLFDLRKAFPSLPWRAVTATADALGIRGTKCWEVINSSHRDAVHRFSTGPTFTLAEGTKEGCCSSPLVFVMTYTPVIRHWRKLCEEHGVDIGVELWADQGLSHLNRADKIWSMGTDTTRNETRERLTDVLFADDTTIFIQMAATLLTELERADREARRKDKEAPLSNVSATSLLQQALRDAGMAENVGKRVQANLATLAVGDEELQELAAEESLMLSQLLDVSFADRVDGRIRLSSLRRKAALPPFAVHVRFLQAKFLAHTMRRPMTELAKAALVGEFVLDAEGGGGTDARGSQVLRTAENNREFEPSIRKVPSVVRDFRKHLQHCGISDELAALLFEPQAEAKARRPQRGPKRKGHRAYVKKIRCVPCGINYTSRSGAMLEHLQAHQRDDYVFIYGIKGPNYKTDGEAREYRPEQHATRGGKPFAGSGAALLEIRPPADAVFFSRAENATFLRCRKCKKIKKPYDPKAKITKMEKGAKASLIHSVRFLQRHEKKCQVNKKTENGSGVDVGALAVVNEDSRDEENDADVSSSEAGEI